MRALALLLAVSACAVEPHQFLCHETSVCDGVPSDEGEWQVCLVDPAAYEREGVERCVGFLVGWCTWYTCQITCQPVGDCLATDAATPTLTSPLGETTVVQ